MADEIELKLALPPEQRARLLRHPLLKQGALLKRQRVVNIYYDTPDLALHAKGIALRLRQQGDQYLQTVKCAGQSAGGLSTRPEWEVPYLGRFDFSCITDKAVRKFLLSSKGLPRLQPCFETTFQRTTWRFEPVRGKAVLMMLDQGAVLAKGRQEVISEVELELDGADVDHLFALAENLASRVSLVPALLSKAERGYRLAAGTETTPVRATKMTLATEQTPLAAFRSIAFNCLEQLLLNQQGAASSDDPEFVHQMRVALRRLHAALGLFSPILPPGVQALDALLRETMVVLGQARDRDVLLDELVLPIVTEFSRDKNLETVFRLLDARRRTARAVVQTHLLAPDYGRFLLLCQQCLHELTDADETQAATLSGFARQQLAQLRKQVRRRAAVASIDDQASLHRLRIAIKRLRYSLEFFSCLLTKKTRRGGKASLVRHQERLGKLQDLTVAQTELLTLAQSAKKLTDGCRQLQEVFDSHYMALQARLGKDLAYLADLPAFSVRKDK